MSKFDAALAVEEMTFDFTKYGGREGTIPEPSTGQMNDFMIGMRRLITEYRQLTPNSEANTEEMDAEELGAYMESMDQNLALATEFNEKSILLTAEFCSGSPSKEELAQLPLRVMRAFSRWLMKEINPKEEGEERVPTPAPRPAPQDRRRATRGSRKVGR